MNPFYITLILAYNLADNNNNNMQYYNNYYIIKYVIWGLCNMRQRLVQPLVRITVIPNNNKKYTFKS